MSHPSSERTDRSVKLSLGLSFIALAATFLKALETIWMNLFTLVPDENLAWGYWMAVSMLLLSFIGMMATLYLLDQEWGAEP